MDERVQNFEWLSVAEVAAILEQSACSCNALRDRFLLSLMYESGARVAEILSLKESDISADVCIFGKGSKPRFTPLSEEIWSQYCRYREQYHSDLKFEELLFYSVRNNTRYRISRGNVARILNECEGLVRETMPHLHCHLFSRTCAMHMLEVGVPMPTIS